MVFNEKILTCHFLSVVQSICIIRVLKINHKSKEELQQLNSVARSTKFTWLATFLWRRQWHPTPLLLPGKSHGRRSLVGCRPRGHKESGTTERLHFHFPLSCIGEGNGSPLQCSCLENPMDGGAWWAAIYGVAQSPTWLKWLSSSSNFTEQPLTLLPNSKRCENIIQKSLDFLFCSSC